MKSMKRSVRRHHYARLKRKWVNKSIHDRYYDRSYDDVDWSYINWLASIYANTPKVCSCWMCANERKIEGVTLQERRNELSYDEQIKEYWGVV